MKRCELGKKMRRKNGYPTLDAVNRQIEKWRLAMQNRGIISGKFGRGGRDQAGTRNAPASKLGDRNGTCQILQY